MQYAWMLLIFAMTTMYSLSCPLITPFGKLVTLMYECTLSYFIIVSIQPLGLFWQEPEPSQATGMALVCCISRQVVRSSLPLLSPAFRDSHFTARCRHIPINTSAPSSERWNCGREWSGNFAEMTPYYTI
jgi:hypothetical protein